MSIDTRPPVPPKPGHWCLRRDGEAFRQDDDSGLEYAQFGSDGISRHRSGRAYTSSTQYDCIGIIGPICAGCDCADGKCTRAPADPYDALHWIERNSVWQAVVPLYGERPEWIRDDDLVRWDWTDELFWRVHEIPVVGLDHRWRDRPAVILRRREQEDVE